MQFLEESKLMKVCPSIFQAEAHESTSERYSLIPTIDCVRGLDRAGFKPVYAAQSRSRNADNKAYCKHIMRFRHESGQIDKGNFPEIVMINSHDGKSSYQLKAGIFRLVCSNGLIVGDIGFSRSIRHQGDVVSKVVEAAGEIIDIVPQVMSKANEWEGKQLTDEARRVFAQSAALLKWDEGEIEISPERLLRPRRSGDTSKDLWSTFNVLQENLIRGGVRYQKKGETAWSVVRLGTTRAVNSVSENSRLNTALWNLTQRMSELVK